MSSTISIVTVSELLTNPLLSQTVRVKVKVSVIAGAENVGFSAVSLDRVTAIPSV